MKLCMKHQRPKPFFICANNDPGPWVDLDLSYGKVKFCNLGFYMGKCDNVGFFWKLLHPVTWNLVNIVN